MAKLKDLKEKLAIAMWDFSWLWQHQKYAAFEDWDQALDGLVARGYNAVRIDAFPHLVAADPEGHLPEEVTNTKNDFLPPIWGLAYTMTYNPRAALAEFMGKCRDRGIYVGLSTWFFGDDAKRNERIQGVDEFVRVWDETLTWLHSNDLLSSVVYVDLLNEYPNFHNLTWLKTMLSTMSEPPDKSKNFNAGQIAFYNQFITDTLSKLKRKWLDLDFFASITETGQRQPWTDIDFSAFDAIDKHHWVVLTDDFGTMSGYFPHMHNPRDTSQFRELGARIHQYWRNNRDLAVAGLEREIAKVAEIGRKWDIPIGNTEGWGAIHWRNHPFLPWDFIKEAGEEAVRLSTRHGYTFICTSNFTHPHFAIWNDIPWHQQLTGIIRGS